MALNDHTNIGPHIPSTLQEKNGGFVAEFGGVNN